MFTNLFNNYNYKRHLKRIVITTLIFLMSIVPTFASVGPMDVSDNTTHVRLQTIINTLTNIYSRQATTNTYIQNIINKITGVTGDTYQSWNIHQLLSRIATNTNSISNSAALTDQKVESIYYSVDGVESSLGNINSNISTTNTSISTANINLENIISEIEKQNNIEWIDLANRTNTNLKYYISDTPIKDISTVFDNFLDITETVVTVPKDKYFYISFLNNANLGGSAIVRFILPLNGQVGNNDLGRVFTKVTSVYGELDSSYFYFARSSTDQRGAFYRFFPGGNSGRHFNSYYILEFLPNYQYATNISLVADAPNTTNAIAFDGNDKNILETMNLFNELYFYKSFGKLVDIYASNDLINAKENQQQYEDSVISDFTGSGSAAASTSDASNLKDVSGSIKNGLDAGGSVNGALGVFNTSGGLWDWFSQSNYNEINGTQNNRLMRGSDEYIDFYNTNYEELQRLLLEESR